MWLAAGAAVALRLPLLGAAPSPDEAGFLAVGAQWRPGGTSLYGDYWVDRPPLLITIFRLAAEVGGLVPLRLIGCLATVLVVLGVAHTARLMAGPRAARWAALVAAALCVSPLTGGLAVNGELLSAPFVAWGVAAMVHAVRERAGQRALVLSLMAGAALAASLMVKQNIADVGVFTAALTLIAWHRGELNRPQVIRLMAAFLAGVLGLLAATCLWALLHGTSLTGVYDALYPFRIRAGEVMATYGSSAHTHRLWTLLVAWAVSGGIAMMAVTGWALLTGRIRDTAAWALAATLTFDVVSVLMGGSYWLHYLVQLVVPIAILAGVVAARSGRAVGTLLVAVAVVATTAWTVFHPWHRTSVGSRVGESIGAVAQPGDTIVTVYGHADLTETSGLRSPYPYLWSLPVKTLDPHEEVLEGVLEGPDGTHLLRHLEPRRLVGHGYRRDLESPRRAVPPCRPPPGPDDLPARRHRSSRPTTAALRIGR